MKKGLYQLKKMILELEEVATDKGVLISEGEITVDSAVYVLDENGEETAAPDGEYTAEDGRVIVVAEGKVAEIKEAEQKPEEAPAEAEEKSEEPAEEKQEAEEPAEEPEPEKDPKDEEIAKLQAQIEELNNIIAEKDEEIGRLKAELEKPEEAPAEEQLKSQKEEEVKPWFKPRF